MLLLMLEAELTHGEDTTPSDGARMNQWHQPHHFA
jgi:hypothetical protein